MNKVFTPEQLQDLGKKIEAAEDDQTPYAIYAGDVDGVSVVGDSSGSYPLKKARFSSQKFRFYKNKWIEKFGEIPEDAEVTGNFVMVSVKYGDISITPRNDAILMAQIIDFFGYFEQERELVLKHEEEVKKISEEAGVEFIKTETGYTTKFPQKDTESIAKANIIYNQYLKDALVLYANLSDSAQIALYNFVGVLLNIPDDMLPNLTAFSVLGILAATIQKYPEFFNETDAVFGV